jgi:cell division protein ZapE
MDIIFDPAQQTVFEKLQILQLALQPRLFKPTPKGLYIHGPVGRGKSMLMDAFFNEAPVANKRRVHFNAFMLDVHARLHAARLAHKDDPVRPVIKALAKEAKLLCFDEFQVSDIADAMIIGRIFAGLFKAGVVVVATSNVAPDDLYKNGLQRALFLPFIALLKEKLEVVEMGSGQDYRLTKLAGHRVYLTPDDAAATQEIDSLFVELSGGKPAAPVEFTSQGRTIIAPQASGSVARFTFAELCRQPLGAADYLALADRFAVLIVEHVPVFSRQERNEALRFITLVDQLYDRKTRLILSAAAPAAALYPANGPYEFEFRRTVSRLIEMASEDWLI